jgi:hypothetical protein
MVSRVRDFPKALALCPSIRQKQRSNEATKQRSNEATKQRSNEATKQRLHLTS